MVPKIIFFKKLINNLKKINNPQFKFEKKYIIFLFIIALIANLALSSVGWDNKITDSHGFRQTQTAISTYYMIEDGITVKYITPVLGPPWSIPMEFPTYQVVVASFVKLFNSPLDQTGRFISLLFFYLALIPLFLILKLFVKNRTHCLLIISFVLLNPIYIFWSRTFMIESTALFLSLMFIYLSLRYLFYGSKNKYYYLILAIIFGTLAGLTKVTTLAVFFIFLFSIITLLFIKDLKNNKGLYLSIKKYLYFCLAVYLVPTIVSFAWVHYTDSIKSHNPFANNFITSAALTKWNFGTLSQKLSMSVWDQIIDFSILIPKLNHLATYSFLVIILLLATLLLKDKYKKWFFVSLVAYFSGPLIFTNLYYIHTYYQYANNLFLSLAIGMFFLSILNDRRYKDKKIVVYLLLPIVFIFMLSGYFVKYYKIQKKGGGKFSFTEIIKNNTNDNSVLLNYGFDWSSEIPYYAERKSISVGHDKNTWISLEDEKLKKSIANTSPDQIEAMIINSNATAYDDFDKELIKNINEEFNLREQPIDNGSGILIYLKKENGQ